MIHCTLYELNSVSSDSPWLEYATWLHSFHHHNNGLSDAQRYVSQGVMEWVMSKPNSEPTSYNYVAHTNQIEKWDFILAGFDQCLKNNVFTTRNNPYYSCVRAPPIFFVFKSLGS